MAGSGAALAPARRLSQWLKEENSEFDLRVGPSIGTPGAVKALRDGIIEVGLASRPLTDLELGSDLRSYAVAKTALAVAAHPDHEPSTISTQDLLAIYRGRTRQWTDGQPIVPLSRPLGDSVTKKLGVLHPDLPQILGRALTQRRAILCLTDQEMRDRLLATPGAIGFLDLGTVRAEGVPVKVLALDGVKPSRATIADGSYRLDLELFWITSLDPSPLAQAFVEFSASSTAQKRLAGFEYVVSIDDARTGTADVR